MSKKLVSYFQLNVSFLTIDSMGANFINSCLEKISKTFQELINNSDQFKESEKKIEIIMSILSNYTPECIVESSVECKIDDLGDVNGITSKEIALKFKNAFDNANNDIRRAVTHNKGIMNGIDAVLISTGMRSSPFLIMKSGRPAKLCFVDFKIGVSSVKPSGVSIVSSPNL